MHKSPCPPNESPRYSVATFFLPAFRSGLTPLLLVWKGKALPPFPPFALLFWLLWMRNVDLRVQPLPDLLDPPPLSLHSCLRCLFSSCARRVMFVVVAGTSEGQHSRLAAEVRVYDSGGRSIWVRGWLWRSNAIAASRQALRRIIWLSCLEKS